MTDELPEKLPLTSMDVAAEKRDELRRMLAATFPEAVAEGKIDLDQIKRVLGEWVEPDRERFGLNWPGKAACMKVIQAPSVGTLKPVQEESVDWETTQNLFIEGDNLEVLKILQKPYFGKIKAIYIDPPYNTGKEFIYPDKYAESLETYLTYTGQVDSNNRKYSTNTELSGRYHSNWLNMMYTRLYLAKNLLSEDGIILISIDENEFHNLKKLADEIFGENNYAGEIVWKNSSRNDQDYISIEHEYILSYVKNKSVNKGLWLEKKEGLDEIYKAFEKFRSIHGNDWARIHSAANEWYKQFPESSPISASKHYTWMDERGVYFPDNISGPNSGQYVYDIEHPVTGKIVKAPSRGWFCPQSRMKDLIADNLVHFGVDEKTVPCLKTYLKKTEYKSISSVKFRDGRAASNRLAALFGQKVFTNPKDEFLLRDIFSAIGVSGNDIVLDFFAGSGTTHHAVLELNAAQDSQCRSILVQLPEQLDRLLAVATGSAKKATENAISYLRSHNLPENIAEIAKERIRLVGKAKRSALGEQLSFDASGVPDFGFRSFRLVSSNFKAWDGAVEKFDDAGRQLDLHVNHVSASATGDELLCELLLRAGFALTVDIETIELAGKAAYSVQGGALLICLERQITTELIDALAEADALQVICLDEGFAGNDQLKANALQSFRARARSQETAIEFRTV